MRTAVQRVIWSEAEGAEAERLEGILEDLLTEEALYDGFAEEPVAAHIARVCAELGLSPPARGDEIRDPSGGCASQVPARLSSA